MDIRFLSSAIPWSSIKEQWSLTLENDHHIVQYNIQPGDAIGVITGEREGKFIQEQMTWGFPASQLDPDLLLFNARSEGIFSQRSYRFLIRDQRCAIPIDGFYVVQRSHSGEYDAYRIHPVTKKAVWLAGVFDRTNKAFSIITKSATSSIQDVTERQPVIITHREHLDQWLFTKKMSEVDEVLKYQDQELTFHATTSEIVNNINSPLLHQAQHKDLTLFD